MKNTELKAGFLKNIRELKFVTFFLSAFLTSYAKSNPLKGVVLTEGWIS